MSPQLLEEIADGVDRARTRIHGLQRRDVGGLSAGIRPRTGSQVLGKLLIRRHWVAHLGQT